jgi:hypothetical protein
VFTHGIILLDFLNEMMAQFCGNQTTHLWNFKMNSTIPASNDGYQTTSKSPRPLVIQLIGLIFSYAHSAPLVIQ